MTLKFLIIHESTVIKDIIWKYVATDYLGAIVDMGLSPEDAVRMLAEKQYDVVLSGMEMRGMSGFDICDRMCVSDMNQKTPLILMSPGVSETQQQKMALRGIQYVLPLPFTSIQFRELICKVFHPEAYETGIRKNIPRTRAMIQLANQMIPADVINISMNKVLCELAPPEASADLSDATQMTVQFPIDYGRAIVIHITGDLMGTESPFPINESLPFRFPASEFLPQPFRVSWKIQWKFFELTTATKKTLRMSLGRTSLPPDFHGDFKHISEMYALLEKENAHLRTRIDALSDEKQDLSHQVSQLQKEVAALRRGGADSLLRDISLSALINEAATRSDDPSKRPIFKRIIEDNVKMRGDGPNPD